MALTAVIPNVFYADLDVGVAFFRDALGFREVYRSDDGTMSVVRRDATCFHLLVNAEIAAQDRPEFHIGTDDIDAFHREVVERAPHALHPDGRDVTDKPWGLREFALRDPTDVCVIIEQPIERATTTP